MIFERSPDLLAGRAAKLPDALCVVGVTMVDLYQDSPDLFIAGLAQGNTRLAVVR